MVKICTEQTVINPSQITVNADIFLSFSSSLNWKCSLTIIYYIHRYINNLTAIISFNFLELFNRPYFDHWYTNRITIFLVFLINNK